MKDTPYIYFCTSFCQGLWGRVLSPYPGGGSRLSRPRGRLNGVFNEERDIVARCRSGWRTTSVANAPSLFSPIRPSSPETFQRRRGPLDLPGFLWRSAVKRDQLVSPGAFYQRSRQPRQERRKKKGKKREYLIAREGGGRIVLRRKLLSPEIRSTFSFGSAFVKLLV